MKDRIQQLMDKYNLSKVDLSEIIGVQTSAIHHILSGRNEPSTKILRGIIEKFPEINLNWLVSGIGEMCNNASKHVVNDVSMPKINNSQPQMLDIFADNLTNDSKNPKDSTLNEVSKDSQSHIRQKSKVSDKETEKKSLFSDTVNVEISSNFNNNYTSKSKIVKKITIYYNDGTYEEYTVNPI